MPIMKVVKSLDSAKAAPLALVYLRRVDLHTALHGRTVLVRRASPAGHDGWLATLYDSLDEAYKSCVFLEKADKGRIT